ncbi:MAG: hypothetical protein QOH36_1622 [Actinomycetota bacterium]|jgi:hypothetical protein|nr:hypothetical protein [Actinomycetota bacterium]MEA2972457.1 hypothetical protein [Actinomycetota bacterium]
MSEPRDEAAHGVHAATREDGAPQEEPAPGDEGSEELAEATETGADAS